MYTFNVKILCLSLLLVGLFVFGAHFQAEAYSLKDVVSAGLKGITRDEAPQPSEPTSTPPIVIFNTDSGDSQKTEVSSPNIKIIEESLQAVVLNGKLTEVLAEPADNDTDSEHSSYIIETKEFGFVPVAFKEKIERNYRNAEIEVMGTWNTDGTFIVENIISTKFTTVEEIVRPEVEVLDGAGLPTGTESVGPLPTTGDRSVLFILANFSNDTSTPITPTEIRNTLYYNTDSANNYYKFISKQRFQLKGLQRPDLDITNWVTLPNTNENCQANQTGTWTNNAYTLARAQGFEPNSYRTVVVLFPAIQNCPLSTGFASVGQLGSTTGTSLIWFLYSPQQMIPRILNTSFIHELGHNLGLLHSNAVQNCQPSMNVVPQGCQDFEYGDAFSTMGQPGDVLKSFNNFNLHQLGWLSALGKVAAVSQPGTYNLTLQAPSLPTKGYQVVTFPLKDASGALTGQSVYLEFRREILPFEYLTRDPNQNVNRGVSVRFAPTDLSTISKTYLLDFHGATWWLADAAVQVGETYQNSTFGFTITPNTTHPVRGAGFTLQLTR